MGLMISTMQLFSLVRVAHYKERALPQTVQKVVFVLGIVQGTSSGVLIILYVINKFQTYTKGRWRSYVEENKQKYNVQENHDRLTVEEMSIEQTHSLLLCRGPEA